MYLPQLLKEYRKKKKLRQKEMADSLGITREHYAQLEEGRKVPSFELLDKISRLLGERLMVLFPSDDPVNRALMDDDVDIPDLAQKLPRPLHQPRITAKLPSKRKTRSKSTAKAGM